MLRSYLQLYESMMHLAYVNWIFRGVNSLNIFLNFRSFQKLHSNMLYQNWFVKILYQSIKRKEIIMNHLSSFIPKHFYFNSWIKLRYDIYLLIATHQGKYVTHTFFRIIQHANFIEVAIDYFNKDWYCNLTKKFIFILTFKKEFMIRKGLYVWLRCRTNNKNKTLFLFLINFLWIWIFCFKYIYLIII